MNWEGETNYSVANQMEIFHLQKDLGVVLLFLFSYKWYLKSLLLLIIVIILI